MHVARVAMDAPWGLHLSLDSKAFDVLDLSPDIPAAGLLPFFKAEPGELSDDERAAALDLPAEIVKAVYVGLQPWRQRMLDRHSDATRLPERPSRYEKAGERVGRVGERIEGAAARRQAKGG